MNRKAMDSNQIFVFVLSLVILGIILVFGTKAIMKMMDRNDEVGFVQFKSQLQHAVEEAASDYGSVKQVTLNLPSNYRMLCFGDSLSRPSGSVSEGGEEYPLLADAWSSGAANIFLVNDDVEQSFLDTRVRVMNDPNNLICLLREQGVVRVRLEGIGRSGVLVGRWQS